MNRIFVGIAAVVVCAAALLYGLVFWPLRGNHPSPQLRPGIVAIRDATIYVSPDRPPLKHASLVARDGRIVAVGPDVVIPPDAALLPCHGCAVTACFWNTHVHFTEPHWSNAAFARRDRLNAQLSAMLTSHGFTTVIDLGSNPRVTISLRRRIESGELSGPFIYTSGQPLYSDGGVPYYVRDTTPRWLLKLVPQPATRAWQTRKGLWK